MEVSVNNDETVLLEDLVVNAANFDIEKIRKGAILLFDKPVEWSSFKLVKKVKFLSKATRVGHAGTLDPLATGLLVVCTGKYTKIIESIQDMPKTYTGVFNFGKTTPSFDLETEFDAEYPYAHIGPADIERALQHFTGTIDQTPPVYSAIKIGGTRAYKFARQGREVEMKSRPVNIYEFSAGGEMPALSFRVNCSKGTYIRTLAHDFGQFLNSGCYLTDLKRTAIGAFSLEHAFDINEFQQLCGF